MTAKIIEILRGYRIWFGDLMGIHEDAFMNLTDDIETLYRPKIDKLNKRIEFQVEANDTLLLQVREMEKEILKLKEIIGVQDELIGWFGTYGQYVPYVEDLQAKITKLKQEAEIKSK